MSADPNVPAEASEQSSVGTPPIGTKLEFRWRKWDGSTHWVHECVYLGSDEWGDWFGQRGGWRSDRPGRSVIVVEDNVMLLPPSGDHVLTMNARPHPTRVYIDIAWDARWSEGEPTGIDMDLDVVDHTERGVYIDDEDEWEEHRVRYGYPLDLVEKLEAVTAELFAKVTAHEPPYDPATAARWLARLVDSTGDPAIGE